MVFNYVKIGVEVKIIGAGVRGIGGVSTSLIHQQKRVTQNSRFKTSPNWTKMAEKVFDNI